MFEHCCPVQCPFKTSANFVVIYCMLCVMLIIHVFKIIIINQKKSHEQKTHKYNDRKCEELGWVCIPLVVESYGCWGAAAVAAFSKLTGCLSTRLNQPKSKTIFGPS